MGLQEWENIYHFRYNEYEEDSSYGCVGGAFVDQVSGAGVQERV